MENSSYLCSGKTVQTRIDSTHEFKLLKVLMRGLYIIIMYYLCSVKQLKIKSMSSFWLTKKMVLEALKLAEGAPQDTMIMFNGSSEVKNGREQTVLEIQTCGKKKTLRADFQKIELANSENNSTFLGKYGE